jgi:hypothetical protein
MSEKKVKKFGTREEVFAGTAQQTKGGLTKDDLFESKGRFVSKRASEAVKVRAPLKTKKTAVSESESEEETPVVKKEVQKIEEKLAATSIDAPVKATRKQASKAPPPTPEISPVVDESETPAPTKSKKKKAQVEQEVQAQ